LNSHRVPDLDKNIFLYQSINIQFFKTNETNISDLETIWNFELYSHDTEQLFGF
jgi:hypothetical protein